MKKTYDFAMWLLLTIITCGIYNLFFMTAFEESVAKETNEKLDLDGAMLVLLTIITGGIYYIIWMYSVQERIRKEGQRRGITITETGTSLILWSTLGNLLCGLGIYIAVFKLIESYNEIIAY